MSDEKPQDESPFKVDDTNTPSNIFSGIRAKQGEHMQIEHMAPSARHTAASPRTDRKLWSYVLLTVVTLGIYPLWYIHGIARDMNTVCEGDGRRTPDIAAFFFFSLVTFGIYSIWWYYKLGERIQANAPAFGIVPNVSGVSLALLMSLGILIIVGPYIGWDRVIRDMNAMARIYCQETGVYGSN